MIRARFYIRNGRYTGFRVSGHSGYALAGHDIVCASVSSAVQLTANTITETAGIKACVKQREAEIELKLPKAMSRDSALLSQAAVRSLRQHLVFLSKQYRKNLSVRIRRCKLC